jgi:hypothetical protein
MAPAIGEGVWCGLGVVLDLFLGEVDLGFFGTTAIGSTVVITDRLSNSSRRASKSVNLASTASTLTTS